MPRRLLFFAVLLAMGVAVGVPAVSGHGVLESVSPPANAAVQGPPSDVALLFSEAVDPAFTTVTVLDSGGRRVSGSVRVSSDGRRIRVALQPLPKGVYTVRWRVLSAVDGHTTAGSYAFAIGVPAPAGEPAAGRSPPLLQVILRWIGYVSALLLAGVAFFAYAIARPALAEAEPHLALSVEEAAAESIRRLSVPSAVILIGSLAAGFVVQALDLFDASLGAVLRGGQLPAMLAGTKLGWSVLLQSAMAAVLLVPPTRRGRVLRMAAVIWAAVAGGLALIGSSPQTGVAASQHFLHFAALLLVGTVYGLISVMAAIILPLVPDLQLPQAAWAAPAAGAILLIGITMNAHAGGEGWVAIGADWIHLAAAAMWIGGLAALVVTLRAAAPELRSGTARTLVPRFSTAAGISLLALVITGSYSAWLTIPAWSGFVETLYGRTLLVKLLLLLPWITLGAFNHFVLRPRLARGGSPTVVQRFVRLLGGEMALAAAVLLAVAALTITPPARVTMPAAAAAGLRLAGISGDLRLRLSVSPAREGWNRYEVAVDRAGSPVRVDGRVQLRFTKLDEQQGPSTLVLTPAGAGSYRGEGAELGLPGWWHVDVILRQRGRADMTVEFPVFFEGGPARGADAAAAELLSAATERAGKISSWREVLEITDGSGGAVVTRFEFSSPDRMRYVTSSGAEAIVIGTTRYVREGGRWTRETQPLPMHVTGPYLEYLSDAEQPLTGIEDRCGNEACRVVLWQVPSAGARFAGWIGESTHVIYRLQMVAPQHYMTVKAFDFDAPVMIAPP